jgi:hypothetical protein
MIFLEGSFLGAKSQPLKEVNNTVCCFHVRTDIHFFTTELFIALLLLSYLCFHALVWHLLLCRSMASFG